MIDEDTGGTLDPSILTEDERVKGYLRQAETVGRRGTVLRYALDLIVRNILEGVQYGEEAYYLGRRGQAPTPAVGRAVPRPAFRFRGLRAARWGDRNY